MAIKSVIYKVQLQVADMDRHYYATHPLTLAQHPSETDERLMVRLLAFALHADERLEFGRGLSTDEDPDLWQRDYSGQVERWIELGQPDESRIRKACGRSREVVVLNYGGRAADLWWEKNASALARHDRRCDPDDHAAARRRMAAGARPRAASGHLHPRGEPPGTGGGRHACGPRAHRV